jgi:hypothetical protein
VIVIETVKTLGNPYVVCFIQSGGPAGWTNFEIKIHKSMEGCLYFLQIYEENNKYVLVFIYSGVDVKHNKTIYEH